MPRLLRRFSPLLLWLALCPVASATVWIESFTGMVAGEKPNGYRYNRAVFPQEIQVFVAYTLVPGNSTVDLDIRFNGVPSDFSCTWVDVPNVGGTGNCFAILPYACGKVTVRARHTQTLSFSDSNPVDLFTYDDPQCLPQCDSCQLAQSGQAPGRPVNAATGKLWYRTTDLALSGPFGLTFSRWYDNQSTYTADLGFGWRHSYSAFLDLSLSSHPALLIAFHDEEDRVTYFNSVSASGVRDQTTGATLAVTAGVYTLTTWNNFKYTFDSSGRLTSLTDRIGNMQTITRDGSNRIDFVTDPLGRTLEFAYDGSNRLVSVSTTPPGLSLSFGYTGANCPAGNLCSATMPDNKTWTYEYATGNNLTKVIDPLAHAEEINTYWEERVSTQQTDGGQNLLTFAYPSATTTTVTDGLGRVTTYTYDPKLLLATNIVGPGCSCGGGQSRAFTYDRFMRKTSETDGLGATHTITWTYGRDVIAMYPNGGFTDIINAYPSATTRLEPLSTGVNRLTSWTHYAIGDARQDLILTETVPSADTAGQNKVTTLTFNLQGLLTARQEQGRIAGTVTTYTTGFGYDTRGRLQTVNGPRTDVTDVTTYAHYSDSDADMTRRGQLQTVTDAVGHVTTYAGGSAPFNTYTLYGQPRRVSDPNAVVREMTYDERGRLTVSVLKGVTGDPTDLTTTSLFDGAGRLTKVTLPLGNGTSYEYDTSNRLRETIRFGADGNQYERFHVTPNVMSEKISEEAQSCVTPAPVCAAWTTRRSDSFQYDSYGRLWQVNHPDATTIYSTYDAAGNLQTVRDENHVAPNTTYGYDLANRLTSVTQTLQGAPGNQITTNYGYDIQDNLNSITDPNTNNTTHFFDDFRRMRQQTSPVTGVTTYAHDPAGNLLTLADANTATTTRSYDAVNRILSAISTRTGLATEAVTFVYDDGTAGNFGKGRLRSMTDPVGSTTYAYERRGLLRSENPNVQGPTYALSYAYDGNGNRRQITYPGGLLVDYTFDFADRPRTASGWVTSATYRPFGPIEQIRYTNGTTKTMAHDNRYRPTGNKLEKDSPLTTLANYQLVPDPVGNIDQINDLLTSGYNRTYDYDDLNRLTTTNSGASLWGTGSHAYDKMGNVTSLALGTARTATFAYVGTTPKLQSVTESGIGTRNVAYDNAGNETALGMAGFGYSPRNYLDNGEGFRYFYDGRGVRMITVRTSGAMAFAGNTRRFQFYSPELNLLSETFLISGAGTPLIQSEYVWFAGQPVGQKEYGFRNTLSWTFTDHLGTPFIQTNSAASISWRAEYEPYGRIFALRTPNHYQSLRLPGQEVQETNTLSTDGNGSSERFYNVFRWYRFRWGRYSQGDPLWRRDTDPQFAGRHYDVETGRFLSQDPIGFFADNNFYRYAFNDPVSLMDPLGLDVKLCFRQAKGMPQGVPHSVVFPTGRKPKIGPGTGPCMASGLVPARGIGWMGGAIHDEPICDDYGNYSPAFSCSTASTSSCVELCVERKIAAAKKNPPPFRPGPRFLGGSQCTDFSDGVVIDCQKECGQQ